MFSPRHYLIQDPYHEYGVQFVEHIHRHYGHRAVCIYSNRRERVSHEATLSKLHANGVAAAFDVNLAALTEFAAMLRARYDVSAMIPFNETSVTTAAELAGRLGLSWAQPKIMLRFRDKFALKEHLRTTAPGIRINASHRVETLADVLSMRKQVAYRRFVLKPNDGYGNRHIGLFDYASPVREIRNHLRCLRGSAVVMEEYVDGIEYFVNGQIDARGHVTIIAIFEYVRRPANGRHNIDVEALKVRHGTRRFARLADYAESVLRATGLQRNPFHLELKVDRHGPCLIEVAARLPGHGNAWLTGELHGPQLNLIELASHYYFHATDFGPVPLDWTAYNSQAVRYVNGIAHRRERIYDLDGILHIEALPEFHRWVKKPRVGAHVERTVDALTMPWSLILKAPTEAQAAAAAGQVRDLLTWNRKTSRGGRVALSLRFKFPRALTRLRQTVQRVLPPLDGRI
jgi:hypothetical protein